MDPSLLPWVTAVLWWLLAWSVAVFLITAGVYMVTGPALRQGRAEARVARALETAGLPILNGVVLRGPRGGVHQVDHIVRLPSGFVVLETCMRAGRLLGRPRDRIWRQDLGLETYHFGNPLRRLERSMAAVRRVLTRDMRARQADGTAPEEAALPLVTGQVLIPGRTRFPRGRPAGVSPLAPFLEDLTRAVEDTAPPDATIDHDAVEAGWRALGLAALTRAPDGPAPWHAAPRRLLRQVLADPRSAAGLGSFGVGLFMALSLMARGMP